MSNSQIEASNPDISVWVDASAGTGKTKVLTDRVLRLLLAGNEPAKILCLTFTKAAAAEMSIRINNELSEWISFSEEKLINRLQNLNGSLPNRTTVNYARSLFVKVLDAKDSLKIQTIHSFCQFLIKKFPIEADINPNFKVIDDQTAKILIKESKLNLLKKISKINNKELFLLKESINYIAWNLQENSFNELIEEIISNNIDISNMLDHYGSIESVIDALKYNLNIKEDIDTLIHEFCNDDKNYLELKTASELFINNQSKTSTERGKKILDWINSDYNTRKINIENYQSAFLTQEKEPLKNLMTKELSKKYNHIYEKLIEEQNRILKFIKYKNLLSIFLQSTHIIRFSKELLDEYKNLKNRQSYLDYNDLIYISYRLLKNNSINDWILYKLDGGIDHVLVDEAQDTSSEQWQIIENLVGEFFVGIGKTSKKRTLFVVGDQKQSIFSFQGADPKIFNYMHSYFKNKNSQNINIFKSIKLDTSYRSTKAVLDMVDNLFSDQTLLKSIQLNELKHIPHRILDAGKASIWPLVKTDNYIFDDQIWPLPIKSHIKVNPYQKLAELIANQVHEWLKSSRILKSKDRPILAGDILILVRRRNDLIDFLIKEFKKKSINVAGADRLIITEHIVIMDLIAFGKFLLLPYDDLNLACLLKSPLIGMDDEDLLDISYNRESSLWNSLNNKINDKDIYKTSYEYLNEFLDKFNSLSVFDLYTEIIDIQNGRQKFHSRLGNEVNELLDEFLSLALKYELNNPSSLQNYIKWLESSNIEIKRDLEQGRDQIRIMTIHSAKGLQAPIVFLPDTNFTHNKNNHLYYCDKDNLIYWPRSFYKDSEICDDLRKKNNIKEEDESYRLLYVALTRAEDELIICGYMNRNTPKSNSWYNIISNSFAKIAKEIDFDVDSSFDNYLINKKQLVVEYEQNCKVIKSETESEIFEDIKILPEFMKRKIDNNPIYQIINPSKTENNFIVKDSLTINKNNCLKGNIIHKLLEYLPLIDKDKHITAAIKYMSKYNEQFTQCEIDKIIDDSVNLISHENTRNIWGENSRAEIEISGIVHNKYIISGKIDRLIVESRNVTIIDYKSTENPPQNVIDIPIGYLKQMSLYKLLISEIYPDRNIDTILIWTSIPNIMLIPDYLIDDIKLF